MKYLFFDLEMANCDNGEPKICEFGYVLADEGFVICDRGNYLMNPDIRRSQWDYYVVKRILTRKVSEYERMPLFEEYFDRIRKLIDGSDMIFGHSMSGDAKALCCECKRYGLPALDFDFYDIKEIYCKIRKVKASVSVAGILKELGVMFSGSKHDAEADASNTMLGLKAICSFSGKDVLQLVSSCPESKDSCKGYEVASIVAAKREKERKVREFISGRVPKDFKMRSFYGKVFDVFAECVRPRKEIARTLRGKRVCIPLSYVESDFKHAVNLVQEIRDRGGAVVCDKKEANMPFEALFESSGISEKDLQADTAPLFECLFDEDAYISNRDVREIMVKLRSERSE